jgi:hypothetical protein
MPEPLRWLLLAVGLGLLVLVYRVTRRGWTGAFSVPECACRLCVSCEGGKR